MVDITQCAVCGRTIPAIEQGCAYCESEREGVLDAPYLPMLVRALLIFFVVAATGSAVLSVMSLLSLGNAPAPLLTLGLSLVRLGLAVATVALVLKPRKAGRYVPALYAVGEIILGLAASLGVLAPEYWGGGIVAPLWSVVFLVFFFRPDVQLHFDPGLHDRDVVRDLLRDIVD